MNGEKFLDISWRAILKISVVVIAFYIIYSVKDILVWFVFALTISVLFNPAINFLEKRRIPRLLGVVLIYVGTFGIFSLLIYLVIPFFTSEIRTFLEFLPQYFEKISPLLRGLGFQAFENIETFLKTFGKTLEGMADNIFNVLFTIFGGVFTTLFVIVTAVFLSLEKKPVERTLILLFPKKYENIVINIWEKCQKKVSGWFAARLLACTFVGIVSYIAFLLFKVNYSFTLALFAGVFNFIPYIGPLLTGIILFLIVFPTAILKGVFVVIAFILIQQIENNILSPILMKKFIGIPPVLVLVSMVIGGKIWGFMGVILIIPLAGIIFEFLREFLEKRKREKTVVL